MPVAVARVALARYCFDCAGSVLWLFRPPPAPSRDPQSEPACSLWVCAMLAIYVCCVFSSHTPRPPPLVVLLSPLVLRTEHGVVLIGQRGDSRDVFLFGDRQELGMLLLQGLLQLPRRLLL